MICRSCKVWHLNSEEKAHFHHSSSTYTCYLNWKRNFDSWCLVFDLWRWIEACRSNLVLFTLKYHFLIVNYGQIFFVLQSELNSLINWTTNSPHLSNLALSIVIHKEFRVILNAHAHTSIARINDFRQLKRPDFVCVVFALVHNLSYKTVLKVWQLIWTC